MCIRDSDCSGAACADRYFQFGCGTDSRCGSGSEAVLCSIHFHGSAVHWTCLLYTSVPAVSFARIANGNVAPIHCRYDVKDVMSMEKPVSYTHLDVYKRQDRMRMVSQAKLKIKGGGPNGQ